MKSTTSRIHQSLLFVTAVSAMVIAADRVGTQSLPTLSVNDASIEEHNGGTSLLNFTLSLSAPSSGDVSVNYATTDDTATCRTSLDTNNPAPITIASSGGDGTASPYPSTIAVPAGAGTITKLVVVLRGLTHTYPADVDVLLVGPTGQAVILMSDVGGPNSVSEVTLTIDDNASALGTGQMTSGTYRPTNLEPGDVFPAPAPAPPYTSQLSSFNGTDSAGTWRLYVADDFPTTEGGAFTSGWSLIIQRAVSADYECTAGVATIPAGAQTAPISVPVIGDFVFELPERFLVDLSGAVGATIADGTGVGTIKNDDYTDHPLVVRVTLIKAVHFNELRLLINAVREMRGLPPLTFSEPLTPQVTPVRWGHVEELRSALPAGCQAAWTTGGVERPINAVYVTRLRAATQACQ